MSEDTERASGSGSVSDGFCMGHAQAGDAEEFTCSSEIGTIDDVSGLIYCGDNLDVLREYVPRESVDLIYLDPPFNSQRTYNLIHKGSQAQEEAFKDFWSWDEAAPRFARLMSSVEVPKPVSAMMQSLHDLLVERDSDLLAYLTMMAERLVGLHRVLKPDGSLYLHCDPTASHYLKMLLDGIFGGDRFLSEIVWQRFGAHNDAKRGFAAVHDAILVYAGSGRSTFNVQRAAHDPGYVEKAYRFADSDGRRFRVQNLASPNPRPNLTYPYKALNGVTYQPHPNGWKCTPQRMRELDEANRLVYPKEATGRLAIKNYLDEMDGPPLSDVWIDIKSLSGSHAERLGYPTQKPIALLERIIACSSNPGDLVLDPFCGCGTTIEAAERLGRRWIGIDISHKAIDVINARFAKMELEMPEVVWHPADIEAARALADADKLAFEKWALRQIGAARLRKKDRGIDGEARFKNGGGKVWSVLVSVKGGRGITPSFVRDLRGTMERESAEIGVFVSVAEPSKEMRHEATRAGFLSMSDAEGPIPRIQFVSLDRLFSDMPKIRAPGVNVTDMPKPTVPTGEPAQLSLALEREAAKPLAKAKKRHAAPGPSKASDRPMAEERRSSPPQKK